MCFIIEAKWKSRIFLALVTPRLQHLDDHCAYVKIRVQLFNMMKSNCNDYLTNATNGGYISSSRAAKFHKWLMEATLLLDQLCTAWFAIVNVFCKFVKEMMAIYTINELSPANISDSMSVTLVIMVTMPLQQQHVH